MAVSEINKGLSAEVFHFRGRTEGRTVLHRARRDHARVALGEMAAQFNSLGVPADRLRAPSVGSTSRSEQPLTTFMMDSTGQLVRMTNRREEQLAS
jgi:hypothetical protein